MKIARAAVAPPKPIALAALDQASYLGLETRDVFEPVQREVTLLNQQLKPVAPATSPVEPAMGPNQINVPLVLLKVGCFFKRKRAI